MSAPLRLVLLIFLILAPSSPAADKVPTQVLALQEHMRSVIDAAEPGVAAVIISHNTSYPALSAEEKAKPGRLGDYESIRREPRILGTERDRLDLSDARNIAANSFGSAVVIDASGLLLTNYHLIENAQKIFVKLPSGTGCYADIHAADARSDLAVLRLINPPAPTELKPIKIAEVRIHDDPKAGKANVYRGQWVISVSHPLSIGFSDGKASASWGILSNVRRRAPVVGTEESRQGYLYQYGSLLQTDARLTLGSSGGALLNLEGELIGLTSSVAAVTGSEASGGYALPMDQVYRRIVEVLKEGREVEYGFLGVAPGEMSGLGRSQGLSVTDVRPKTPASDAGLRVGDIIQAVDGRPIREAEDLFLLVGGALADNAVTLTIIRDGGRSILLTAKLAKYAHPHAFIASTRPAALKGLRVEYSSILSQQLQAVGVRGIGEVKHQGVMIRELEPDSPAEAAFKKLGDAHGGLLITHINGQAVKRPSDFYAAVKDDAPNKLTVVNAMDGSDRGRTVMIP